MSTTGWLMEIKSHILPKTPRLGMRGYNGTGDKQTIHINAIPFFGVGGLFEQNFTHRLMPADRFTTRDSKLGQPKGACALWRSNIALTNQARLIECVVCST
jgi:hypothetical protein